MNSVPPDPKYYYHYYYYNNYYYYYYYHLIFAEHLPCPRHYSKGLTYVLSHLSSQNSNEIDATITLSLCMRKPRLRWVKQKPVQGHTAGE